MSDTPNAATPAFDPRVLVDADARSAAMTAESDALVAYMGDDARVKLVAAVDAATAKLVAYDDAAPATPVTDFWNQLVAAATPAKPTTNGGGGRSSFDADHATKWIADPANAAIVDRGKWPAVQAYRSAFPGVNVPAFHALYDARGETA